LEIQQLAHDVEDLQSDIQHLTTDAQKLDLNQLSQQRSSIRKGAIGIA